MPEPIEWLTDNGSCYTARDTRTFARDIGLIPRTTPVSSPQSNGMAETFVRTLKRDHVPVNPRPDARTSSYSCQPGSNTITGVSAPRPRLQVPPRVHRDNPRGPVNHSRGTNSAEEFAGKQRTRSVDRYAAVKKLTAGRSCPVSLRSPNQIALLTSMRPDSR